MKKKEKKMLEAEELMEVIEEVAKAEDVAVEAQSNEVAESDADEVTEETREDEIGALCAEIETLRAELEEKRAECERIFADLKEFALTFPKRTVASITEDVWERVREGVPLAAAYALIEKKREASEGYAQEINRRNAERSSGAISSAADGGYYSPEEVKKMTAYEVKKNYNLIIESMKKWN